jgi:hypothetical protein
VLGLYSSLVRNMSKVRLDTGLHPGLPPQLVAKNTHALVTIKAYKPTDLCDSLITHRELFISAVAVDGTWHFDSIKMSVRLPSLVVMDKDAARDFCSTLVSRLHLEVPYNWTHDVSPNISIADSLPADHTDL